MVVNECRENQIVLVNSYNQQECECNDMEKEYRYKSENTLQYVYLHDCDCSHLYYKAQGNLLLSEEMSTAKALSGLKEQNCADSMDSGCLVFEMEWMEILRGHPLNPFRQAYQTGEGRIELLDPRIVECTLASGGDGAIRQVEDCRELDLYGLEFLDYEETQGCCAEMYMVLDRGAQYRGIYLKVAYAKSIVMWDDFNGVSWVEEVVNEKV